MAPADSDWPAYRSGVEDLAYILAEVAGGYQLIQMAYILADMVGERWHQQLIQIHQLTCMALQIRGWRLGYSYPSWGTGGGVGENGSERDMALAGSFRFTSLHADQVAWGVEDCLPGGGGREKRRARHTRDKWLAP